MKRCKVCGCEIQAADTYCDAECQKIDESPILPVEPSPVAWEELPPAAATARLMVEMGMDPEEADRLKEDLKEGQYD